MTLYTRSDSQGAIVAVAAGGCGQVHSRPVVDGAPVNPWALTCVPCEAILEDDPGWVRAVTDIPETPDEQRIREDYEKRGAKDQDHMMALALGKIAGVDIPDSLTRVTSGQKAHIPAAVRCPDGHENPAGQKFCGSCGVTVAADRAPGEPSWSYAKDTYMGRVADVQLPEPPAAPEPGPAVSPLMSYSELRRLAVARGLPAGGTKADLLKRLQEPAAA